MACALKGTMHPFFFAMKRGYYATLRFSRSMVRSLGLTPARVDILMLFDAQPSRGAMEQAWMTRALGLSRSVVSRMIKRMRELGLLRSWRHPMDRRRKFVGLTEAGAALLDDFIEECLKWRVTDLALATILAPRSWFRAAAVDAALRRVERPLWNLRRGFGDVAARRFGDDPWGRWVAGPLVIEEIGGAEQGVSSRRSRTCRG